MAPTLPQPRGPLSASLFDHWTNDRPLGPARTEGCDPVTDDDLHLALWACYQLHYDGFDTVDDVREWDPMTLAFRGVLERTFERALRAEHRASDLPSDPVLALRVLAERAGPPLSATVEQTPGRDRLEELAIHRSAYQLKEADPHTWGIPRLRGPGRAAMIRIQNDEYGDGEPGCSHAELFGRAMEDLGLDSSFGAYVDRLPGATLATDNLISMFGLHRRLRGALVGHLALFEMCSVAPMLRYLTAARRLPDAANLERFYEVHVEADAVHSLLALNDMVAPMVAHDPSLGPDVVFGAAALGRVESRFARHILDAWNEGSTSLRRPTANSGRSHVAA
jgi:hypothetical protein